MKKSNTKVNLIFSQISLSPNLLDSTNEFSFILRPSPLGGVGVFATHGIEKGTRLKLFPSGVRIVPKFILVNDKNLQEWCNFFGVEMPNGNFSIPKSFSNMDIGWYTNHDAENYNSFHDKGYRYFAKRNIQAGEEITIHYGHL